MENILVAKGYALIDKNCMNVDCAFAWADGRELPADFPVQPNQEVLNIDYDSRIKYFDFCYNPDTQQFEDKLKIEIDKNRIDSLNPNDVVTVTITYPVSINEKCRIIFDNQMAELDVVEGSLKFQLGSEIIGTYTIQVESTSHYGKNTAFIEVI